MAESTAVAQRRELSPFEAILLKARRSIVSLVGSSEAADILAVLIMNQARKSPNLFKCTENSIIDAVVRIARLKLDPALPNDVWLIPYNVKYTYTNEKGREVEGHRYEATLQYGYGGLRKLVLRSPEVKDVFALPVCENDRYVPAPNQVSLPIHCLPAAFAPRGRTIGYYAAALLSSGIWRVVSMSKAEVANHRDRYSQGAKSNFWKDNLPGLEGLTNFDKMALKTCLRMLCSPRLLNLSSEVQAALAAEERMMQETPAQIMGYQRDGTHVTAGLAAGENKQTLIGQMFDNDTDVDARKTAQDGQEGMQGCQGADHGKKNEPGGNQGHASTEFDPVASASLDAELLDAETGELV